MKKIKCPTPDCSASWEIDEPTLIETIICPKCGRAIEIDENIDYNNPPSAVSGGNIPSAPRPIGKTKKELKIESMNRFNVFLEYYGYIVMGLIFIEYVILECWAIWYGAKVQSLPISTHVIIALSVPVAWLVYICIPKIIMRFMKKFNML